MKHQSYSAGVVLFVVFQVCIVISCHHNAFAQDTLQLPSLTEHPELYVNVQDSLMMYLVDADGDTVDAAKVSAAYSFKMIYDSLGKVIYDFTECQLNGNRLRLQKWVDGRIVNADAILLSFNSTTDTFTCHTGDTLSFYRDLNWRDPMTDVQDTNNYYALDSLDFSVELVNTSDSNRVALLDSIGALANVLPGAPRLHGTRPVMAIVQYVIPPSLNDSNVFVRILVYHRGPGEYWFTRYDETTIGLSERMNDSNWIDIANLFGECGFKSVQSDLLENVKSNSRNTSLVVRNSYKLENEVSIAFDSAPNDLPTVVGVYDASGNPVFFPFMTTRSHGELLIRYQFEKGGLYFIALIHGSRIVNAVKVQIKM